MSEVAGPQGGTPPGVPVVPGAVAPAGAVPAGAAPADAAPPAGGIRASDAEREAAVGRLQEACAEGRLTLEEMGSRVSGAYGAVFRTDLEPLLADLPIPSNGTVLSPSAPTSGAVVTSPPVRQRGRWIVGVMSSLARQGHWRLPSSANVVAVMAQAELDLRDAVIDSPIIEMRLFVLMGEIRIRVPKEVEVEVTGLVVMGERHVDVRPVAIRPGMPRLLIRVVGAMGEVRITDH